MAVEASIAIPVKDIVYAPYLGTVTSIMFIMIQRANAAQRVTEV